jgi:hypothetical protein
MLPSVSLCCGVDLVPPGLALHGSRFCAGVPLWALKPKTLWEEGELMPQGKLPPLGSSERSSLLFSLHLGPLELVLIFLWVQRLHGGCTLYSVQCF